MANTIRTKDIGLELIRLIDTGAGLSLVTAQLGDLSEFLGPDDISLVLPAVLVRPHLTESAVRALGNGPLYRVVDTFRILYVREFNPADERVPLMCDNVKAIVDALSADHALTSLSLAPGQQIEFHTVSQIEWEPVENQWMAAFKTAAKAVAVIDQVRMLTLT